MIRGSGSVSRVSDADYQAWRKKQDAHEFWLSIGVVTVLAIILLLVFWVSTVYAKLTNGG